MVAAIASKPETASPYERRRFTLDEYLRLWEAGFFEGERIELVQGEIICMSPIGTRHDTGVGLSDEAMKAVYKRGYCVRVQSSFEAPDATVVQPDIAVLPGKLRDYRDTHPKRAVLIIEVADTSLEYDRAIKACLYARARVPEYWILNLVDRRLEVYRNPGEMPGTSNGYGYRSLQVYLEGDRVSLLETPEKEIKVADLLP